jgi:hypothetical protein
MATVFNQYYFDVLKKLRSLARDRKYDEKQARGLLKAIKRHYLSWDKDSAEYRNWFNEAEIAEPWNVYAGLDNDLVALEAWTDETSAVLYKDIPVGMVRTVFADTPAFHYFSTILCILRRAELPAEEIQKVIATLKAIAKEPTAALAKRVTEIADADVRRLMERAIALHTAQRSAGAARAAGAGAGGASGPDLSGLEETSLGKLAKEIMAEVDVDQLQKSVGEDGDILKALANPDSGLLKLVGTVSQKMVSKMASGELNQENLLSDALQFATKMGGSIPGMGNLAGMGDMLSSIMGGGGGGRGGAGGGGGLDMSMLTSLMGMMGGGGGGGAPAAPGAAGRAPGARAGRPNMGAANQHLRRKTQARGMRDRLERRKENVQGSVEGTDANA